MELAEAVATECGPSYVAVFRESRGQITLRKVHTMNGSSTVAHSFTARLCYNVIRGVAGIRAERCRSTSKDARCYNGDHSLNPVPTLRVFSYLRVSLSDETYSASMCFVLPPNTNTDFKTPPSLKDY